MNLPVKVPAPRKPILFDRIVGSDDLLAAAAKLVVGGLIAACWLLGYSYSSTFFGSLGISVSNFEFSLFEYIFRGVVFFVSVTSGLVIFLILLVFTGLLLASQKTTSVKLEVTLYCLAFFILISGSIALGNWLAKLQLQQIERGGGRVAACLLDSRMSLDTEIALAELIEAASENETLRFVAKDATNHYFIIVPDQDRQNDEWIKSYNFPSTKVVLCTISSPLPAVFGR